MLRGLIFDVDGTLADTEQGGHRVAFNRAFAELGLDWEWEEGVYDELLQVFGGKERIRHFIDRYLDGFIAPAGVSGFIGDLHKRKTRHYLAMMKSGEITLRPGVERLLIEARPASDCLAIEDSGSGLKSASAAGLKTVVTVNDSTRAQNFAGAAIMLEHLGDPGNAFSVLAGDAHGATHVDVPLLRLIHATANKGTDI